MRQMLQQKSPKFERLLSTANVKESLHLFMPFLEQTPSKAQAQDTEVSGIMVVL